MKALQFIAMACFLVIPSGYAQKFVSENEITAQKFGTETLYKSDKTDEPLDGDYKVALGGGSFYEVHFAKGRMHGKYKRFSSKGDLLEESSYNNGELDGKKAVYNQFDPKNLERLMHYKKGKPDGKWQEFNSKGKLLREDNFTNGKLNGEQKKFDSDGNLRLLETYKDDVKHGKFWGKMVSNRGDYQYTRFYKDGEPSGKWKEVNENGTLKKEVEYTNKDTYTEREYFGNGNPKIEIRVKNGKRNGICKEFYDTGVVAEERDYKDDKIIVRKTFHVNGKLSELWNLANGELHGAYLSMNSEGKKEVEGNYTNGLRDGTWKYYYQDKDNFLEKETPYVRGNKEGVFKSYHRSGKLYTEGFYKNDTMHGTWKYYTEGGKLEKEDVYDHRNLIKSTQF
ncbi:toxin-antitoxin system YwqK family antitoxin [Capnocytophaga sp.]|uniref:toxin-antitoxin system YwqK family antitoxin n=1 Tax=Capnocytophaga sp. TaxID=44737 RepID=UPI0026DA8288|nr:toxin-antitoxin system YwqK family antitoxin [Capnocytophaga sp.]MDO5104647.1 toxin-antitoxin system YwqK family antitoxin [Capnocytophaga sp.]